jgi:hypothetical protein
MATVEDPRLYSENTHSWPAYSCHAWTGRRAKNGHAAKLRWSAATESKLPSTPASAATDLDFQPPILVAKPGEIEREAAVAMGDAVAISMLK